MTIKQFRKIIRRMIEDSEMFVTDINTDPAGFFKNMHDDEIVVSGQDDSEVFVLTITKVYE